jgi:hypothetical protein
VSDRIEKTVLALVAPDFADNEDRVYYQAGDDDAEENDAQDE